MRRILHMDSDIPSIYFPIGKIEDGGSCEFATETCILNCPSGMISNKHEKYAFSFFKKNDVERIFNKLLMDYNYLANRPYNAKMIQWFCWGDCPSFMTEKVADVIKRIAEYGIPQYGFTRNKKLWEILPSTDRLHIGLTVENYSKALGISKTTDKMIAHPDYDTWYAQMIFHGKVRSRCNGWWCVNEIEERNSDCTRCLSHGEGCYYRGD